MILTDIVKSTLYTAGLIPAKAMFGAEIYVDSAGLM